MENEDVPLPPKSTELKLSFEGKKTEEIDKDENYLRLPPHLVLAILQGIKIRVSFHSSYRLTDFYGYFSRDFSRKVFCVFPFVSIHSNKDFQELPFRDLLHLECDHKVIPGKFFGQCKRLHTLNWCKINDENLPAITRISTLENLDVSIDVLHDGVIEGINEIGSLKSLRIVTWSKNYPQALRLEKNLDLKSLEKLILFDFPALSPNTQQWSCVFVRDHKSLRTLEFVNCVVSSAVATAVSKNRSVETFSVHNSVIHEDVVFEIFAHNECIQRVNFQGCSFENVNAFNLQQQQQQGGGLQGGGGEMLICPRSRISHVNLSHIPGVPISILRGVVRMGALKFVDLSACALTDAKMNELNECTWLDNRGQQDNQGEEENEVVFVVKKNPDLSSETLEKMSINHTYCKLIN